MTVSISTIIKILTSEFLSNMAIIITIITCSAEVHHYRNSSECDNDLNPSFFFLYRKAREQEKKVVVAGCVPQAQPRMDYLKGLSIIGVR